MVRFIGIFLQGKTDQCMVQSGRKSDDPNAFESTKNNPAP